MSRALQLRLERADLQPPPALEDRSCKTGEKSAGKEGLDSACLRAHVSRRAGCRRPAGAENPEDGRESSGPPPASLSDQRCRAEPARLNNRPALLDR